ncbi:phosphoribosyltransferase [Sulfurospirillum multivorans]|uniref:Nucleotide phosphoribosyltransferase n=2 Tax=Sulfurospirillum multivorans TaxID=66821 RepID=A0AA86APR1_SULMK|nr:phosphoribosyltransferase family protein [Sulfurospirillum multivorans]AHJ13607.1 putative nucleotide phosphoribosyltransferase [Sulfurospirillum multivorans DSM 12446]QEH07097.1 putative nucleotide phosphoribosyltransferase [Sulfurospirillum multivorans]
MRYYSYEEFKEDVNTLAKEIKPYNPDVILAVARGGMTLGHFLAEALEMRNLYAINSVHYEETRKLDTIKIFNIPDLSKAKRVVIVDDIIDSGETMIEIERVLGAKYPDVDFKIAAVFYKEKALLRPDFAAREATEWIEFFWDFQIDNIK